MYIALPRKAVFRPLERQSGATPRAKRTSACRHGPYPWGSTPGDLNDKAVAAAGGTRIDKSCFFKYHEQTQNQKMNGRILSLLFFFLLVIGLTGDERIYGKRVMVSVENLKRHVETIHFDRNPYGGLSQVGAGSAVYSGRIC